MSEKVRILYYALWIAHPLLQAGIAAAMLRHKLHRKFKFFFAYLCTQIFFFALIFPTYWHNYSAAFYISWCFSVWNKSSMSWKEVMSRSNRH